MTCSKSIQDSSVWACQSLVAEEAVDAVGPDAEASLLIDDDRDVIERLPILFSGEAPKTVEELMAMEKHFAELYKKVESSVVNIRAGEGQGSGVVVSSDGYILTAAHVIGRPNTKVRIEFPDGSIAEAITLGMERDLDSGMLRITRMLEDPIESELARGRDSKESEDDETKNDEDEDDEKEQDNESEEDESEEDDSDEMKESDEDDSEEKDSDEEDSDEDDSDDDESGDEDDSDDDDESEKDESEKDGAENSDSDESEKDQEDDQDDSEDDDSEDDDSEEEESDGESELDEPLIDEDLPSFDYLDLGLSGELKRGQWVMAIGHPGGIDQKRGLVMRVGRILSSESDKLQTDCTLVGGDSGGPLIDMAGNVVGIHSRIGSNLTDNLHVPVDAFSEKWDRLDQGFILDRVASLGFRVKGDTTVVTSISRNRAAQKAGLERGDKVLRVGDTEVKDKKELIEAIRKLRPFDKVKIVVKRKRKEIKLDAVVDERRE